MEGSDDSASIRVETAAVGPAGGGDAADGPMVVADLKSVSGGFLKPTLKEMMTCALQDWPSPMTSSPIPAHPCPSPSTSTPASSETPGPDPSCPPSSAAGGEAEAKSGDKEDSGAAEAGEPVIDDGEDEDASQATAELLSLLDRLAALDGEGWFQAPVTDVQAPGYSAIIKHPMCLRTMRTKVTARAYTSWGDLVRDFELLCSNAMRYNQKRSRIHKQALGLLRAGKKLLVEAELSGRRAVAAIASAAGHGFPASAVFESKPRHTLLSPLLPDASLLSPATTVLCSSGSPAGDLLQGLPSPAPLNGVSSSLAGATPPVPPPLPEIELELSDYGDTDLEGPDTGDNKTMATAEGGEDKSDIGGGVEVPGFGATFLPWPQGHPSSCGSHERGDGIQRHQSKPSGRASALEWQVTWLELRLRDLRAREARYERLLVSPSTICTRQRTSATAHRAALVNWVHPLCGSGRPSLPSDSETAEQGAKTTEEGAKKTDVPVSQTDESGEPGSPFGKHYTARAYAALELLERRVDALQASIDGNVATSTTTAEGTPADPASGTITPLSMGLSLRPRPADRRGFFRTGSGALERSMSLSSPRGTRLSSGNLMTPRSASALLLGSGAATPRGGLLTPRSAAAASRRGNPRGRPPGSAVQRSGGSAGALSRDGSGTQLGIHKRRRTASEYDIGEMLTPGALGAPKFVERIQVKTIDTPGVRLLPDAEIKRRWAAVDAVAAVYAGEGGKKQLAKARKLLHDLCSEEERKRKKKSDDGVPGGEDVNNSANVALKKDDETASSSPSLKKRKARDALSDEALSSSSDEDDSDEAFLARHAALEIAERSRYEAACDKPNRNKKPGKGIRGKGQGRGRPASRPTSPGGPGPSAAAHAARALTKGAVSQRGVSATPCSSCTSSRNTTSVGASVEDDDDGGRDRPSLEQGSSAATPLVIKNQPNTKEVQIAAATGTPNGGTSTSATAAATIQQQQQQFFAAFAASMMAAHVQASQAHQQQQQGSTAGTGNTSKDPKTASSAAQNQQYHPYLMMPMHSSFMAAQMAQQFAAAASQQQGGSAHVTTGSPQVQQESSMAAMMKAANAMAVYSAAAAQQVGENNPQFQQMSSAQAQAFFAQAFARQPFGTVNPAGAQQQQQSSSQQQHGATTALEIKEKTVGASARSTQPSKETAAASEPAKA